MTAGRQESLAAAHGTELFQFVLCGQAWGSLALPACPNPEGDGWWSWESRAAGREGASLVKENWSGDLSTCGCVHICGALEASAGI